MVNRLDVTNSGDDPLPDMLSGELRELLGLAPRPAWRPYLMGVVNATPDSFSDVPGEKTVADRVELAGRLIADGADIIDVGGESGVTNKPAVDAQIEIDRVVPVIAAIAKLPGAVVSVDTYKPAVARAAIGRKDFIGARTGRGPREREAGTLAALGAGADHGVAIVRVHDVAAAADFLTVRAALNGQLKVDAELSLAENKRRVEEGS